MDDAVCILGAGVTGLAVGRASGHPVYEAASVPGGICSSYYVRPGTRERLFQPPEDGHAYRFEIGGGHWIFGGDPVVLRFIERMTPVDTYRRRSAVYLREEDRYVPYPLQYHLAHLDAATAQQILGEIDGNATVDPSATMEAWLHARFGPTLTRYFFGPFHERYTAGLWTQIAPQDPYKSPVDLRRVQEGMAGHVVPAGYNVRFVYPRAGLDALARRMARACPVHYGQRAVAIDLDRRCVAFEKGPEVTYDTLVSTLPLNTMMELTGLASQVAAPDPYTSVLVLNIGAVRGPNGPDHHWIYVPDSGAGHFRIGCYSNVDAAFLPRSARERRDRVGLYVERAFRGGEQPREEAIDAYARTVVDELQAAGFIEEVEALDPTWIDVAYTWRRPGSTWRNDALQLLAEHDIVMVGRYGRWVFQGIADSIRDGFVVGAALRGGTG